MSFLELVIFWKSCSPTKAILIRKEAELIKKKEFAIAALNSQKETYLRHVVNLNISNSYIHFF